MRVIEGDTRSLDNSSTESRFNDGAVFGVCCSRAVGDVPINGWD